MQIQSVNIVNSINSSQGIRSDKLVEDKPFAGENEQKFNPTKKDSFSLSEEGNKLLERDKSNPNDNELSESEKKRVQELRTIDRKVKAHEQAHVAAGGGLVRGGPSYEYETGPDKKRYAVAGEVQIDSAPVPDDPQATIRKMQQVRRAALAPVDPSPQDRSVANQASRTESRARAELSQQRIEDMKEMQEDMSLNSENEKNVLSEKYQELVDSSSSGNLINMVNNQGTLKR